MQLTLFLNHRCNLRCSYCYTGRKFDRAMPLDIARRAIDYGFERAATSKHLVLSFFGGEPMLELDLMRSCCEYALDEARRQKRRLFFSLSTNGTLLDAPRLELLQKFRFEVQVSHDGCREAQDATRTFQNGRSSFDRVDGNLRALIAAGFKPRVISVVDPANVRWLAKRFDHLMDLGVPHIYFAPNHSADWNEAACDAFEAALRELGERYMARLRAGQDVRLDPLNGKIVTHLLRERGPLEMCGFGREELAVSPSGRLYPCDRLVCEDGDDAVCIGDLERGLDVEKRDRLVAAKRTSDPECAACELRVRCMTWCGCVNYQSTGEVGGVSPILCWMERSLIAEADRVASTLYAEQDPTFLRRFYARALQPRVS